jgi:hypothetical protein
MSSAYERRLEDEAPAEDGPGLTRAIPGEQIIETTEAIVMGRRTYEVEDRDRDLRRAR